ncbi:hypothetical protein I6E81_07590 [Salinibacterium sp. NG22]|uniref:hypothetical protein n=1 Tax=Salinibacterium sp. NG22 TaxID=2792040 RepID=UPI0018CCE93A|nr:hypothetical protein [Salinibacterium sp. NG22]MBH0110027.1 hypothetical protein [Salinibacterium sp. NG22]
MGITLAIIGVAVVVLPFLWPLWRKWEISRERETSPRKRMSGGFIAPFDEVFHPTAYSAHLLWEAEQSIPAPAPDSDDDNALPDLADGRIVIHVNDNA